MQATKHLPDYCATTGISSFIIIVLYNSLWSMFILVGVNLNTVMNIGWRILLSFSNL